MKQMNWCCLVSQSGKEVYNICHVLNIVPKLVLTNNPSKLREDVNTFLKSNGCTVKHIPFNPLLEHYLQEDVLSSTLITLHGYLRILPSKLIESYKPRIIYNGHPGLITIDSTLKGKDPQIKAWNRKDPRVGSVIHKVTEGVDEGEIVEWSSRLNTATSLDEMYDHLRETSILTWISFLKEFRW